MKKILLIVVSLFSLITLGFVSAETDLGDIIKNLGTDFGYVPSTQEISVGDISNSSVKILSPVVLDDLGDKVDDYLVVYGPHPLIDIISGTGSNVSLLDDFKNKQIIVKNIDSKDNFDLTLTVSDDSLDPTKTYYLFLIPNSYLKSGSPSNDVCFRLSDKKFGKGTECKNGGGSSNGSSQHNSAVDFALSNYSFTFDKDTKNIILTWTKISGINKLEIFLRDDDNDAYRKLDTVGIGDEKFSFKVDGNGEYIIKIIPEDANGNNVGVKSDGYIDTVTVRDFPSNSTTTTGTTTTTTTTTSTITKVPVVGPKENIFIVIAISFGLYIVFRVFFVKKNG